MLLKLIDIRTHSKIIIIFILDAATIGQLRLVKMLVERGADPCLKNRKGKTACDVAAPAVHNFLISARGQYIQ